jgi:AhpD family alkylhydroperoxidase
MQEDHFMENSIRDYKAGLGRFREKLPDVADSYMEFTAACFRDGAVAAKNKQLIALGISVCAQDEYCIMYHTQQAMEMGATEQEILETIGVCAAFGGGAALSQGVTLVQQVIAGQGYGEH